MGAKHLILLFNVAVGILLLIMSKLCWCDKQYIGNISLGMEASQTNYIDKDFKFLLSNNRIFAFGFVADINDSTKFLLVIVHMASSTVLWTANRALPVSNYDDFVFDESGNAFLQKDGTVIWSTNTINKGVSTMMLQDTGNLVLVGSENNSTVIWQSFDFPTDTLIPSQDFKEGMKLTSEPSPNNLTYVLEIKSGNVILSAGFKTPQTYWTMQKDNRRTIDKDGDVVSFANLSSNSWRFYDNNNSLLWQFIFAVDAGINSSWIAVLGSDGVITFSNVNGGGSNGGSSTRIPQDPCETPEPCEPYSICSNNRCLKWWKWKQK